jgi:hypothetical protein
MNKRKIIEQLNFCQGTLDFFYKFFDEGTAKQKMIEIIILRLQEVIDELNK